MPHARRCAGAGEAGPATEGDGAAGRVSGGDGRGGGGPVGGTGEGASQAAPLNSFVAKAESGFAIPSRQTGACGLQFDGLGMILDGPVVLTLRGVREAPVAVGTSVSGIQFDGLSVIPDGRVVVASPSLSPFLLESQPQRRQDNSTAAQAAARTAHELFIRIDMFGLGGGTQHRSTCRCPEGAGRASAFPGDGALRDGPGRRCRRGGWACGSGWRAGACRGGGRPLRSAPRPRPCRGRAGA